ncbi:MAG: hypothetical protein J4G03_07930 [Gemmatimonadetes bacterium]|nr:hypothetical protein [Gemmatimonadota bacterium]
MDANLLVLLVAGALDPEIIAKHKRLRTFGTEDFERVQEVVSKFERVLVTPNTLTEASNLLGQHREPERSGLLTTLRRLIGESHEVVVASADAAGHPSFLRLGLTDAGLLGLVSRDTPLVTVDLDLYRAALHADPESAVNYRHVQQRYPRSN